MKSEKEILINIGKVIIARRKELMMTQEDLAFSADVDRTYVGYIENGKQNISLSILIKIATVLNLEMKDFFND